MNTPLGMDPDVIKYGYSVALYRRWLRQELFMVRMYAQAHLWPEPPRLTEQERVAAINAVAVWTYLLRLVSLS